MKRNRLLIAVLTLPGLLAFTAVLPLPLVRTIWLSLYSWNVLEPAHYIGLANFTSLFTADPTFVRSLLNTLYLVAGSVVLQLPLAFILAYWFGTGKVRGMKFFRAVFFFPVIVSGTAVGLLWSAMLQPDIGIVDAIIRVLGFHGFHYSWLASPNAAIWMVVVSVSWQYFGYHMVIFAAGMSTISGDVFDAAQIDGAGEWRQITSIAIPILRPFLLVSLILILSSSVITFANVLALTAGGPAESSSVLALQMYKESFFYQRYGYGSAIAVVLFFINILLIGGVTLYTSRRSGGNTLTAPAPGGGGA